MKFKTKIIIPQIPKEKTILNLFHSIGLNFKFSNNESKNIIGPNLRKLFFLYKLVTMNKRLTILLTE